MAALQPQWSLNGSGQPKVPVERLLRESGVAGRASYDGGYLLSISELDEIVLAIDQMGA